MRGELLREETFWYEAVAIVRLDAELFHDALLEFAPIRAAKWCYTISGSTSRQLRAILSVPEVFKLPIGFLNIVVESAAQRDSDFSIVLA